MADFQTCVAPPPTQNSVPVDGITHKALAEALKRLERNGLVERHVLATAPVGVEYTITPLGHSLREPFAALYDWALVHGGKMEVAQAVYDRTRDQ
jgi:DNA-binding HxlR family transcriptional regulator